jgi:hypothetical protein
MRHFYTSIAQQRYQFAMEENEVDENGSCSPLSINGLALTEYTASPSPPRPGSAADTRSVVPPEFILPNGYPDV